MDKGIYVALSGGLAKSHELELIANNLANANTAAFKSDNGTFNEYLPELRRPDSVEALGREIQSNVLMDGRPAGDKSFVEMDGVYTDFSQGVLRSSGRRLDLGLEGKGFFEILTPEGVRFSRQGNFKISAQGTLVNADGFPVLSKNIDLPPEDRLIQVRDALSPEQRTVDVNENLLEISADGVIRQEGVELNVIALREFHEPQWLEKVGASYFRNTDPKNLKPGFTETAIHQGTNESSNVNALSEMTRLIEASRAYESQLQAIKTFNQLDDKVANELPRG